MVNAASPHRLPGRGLCAYGGIAAHPFGPPLTGKEKVRLVGRRIKRRQAGRLSKDFHPDRRELHPRLHPSRGWKSVKVIHSIAVVERATLVLCAYRHERASPSGRRTE